MDTMLMLAWLIAIFEPYFYTTLCPQIRVAHRKGVNGNSERLFGHPDIGLKRHSRKRDAGSVSRSPDKKRPARVLTQEIVM